MRCPECGTKMNLVKQCCDDQDFQCKTTHFELSEPYYKCPKCKVEIEEESLEE